MSSQIDTTLAYISRQCLEPGLYTDEPCLPDQDIESEAPPCQAVVLTTTLSGNPQYQPNAKHIHYIRARQCVLLYMPDRRIQSKTFRLFFWGNNSAASNVRIYIPYLPLSVP